MGGWRRRFGGGGAGAASPSPLHHPIRTFPAPAPISASPAQPSPATPPHTHLPSPAHPSTPSHPAATPPDTGFLKKMTADTTTATRFMVLPTAEWGLGLGSIGVGGSWGGEGWGGRGWARCKVHRGGGRCSRGSRHPARPNSSSSRLKVAAAAAAAAAKHVLAGCSGSVHLQAASTRPLGHPRTRPPIGNVVHPPSQHTRIPPSQQAPPTHTQHPYHLASAPPTPEKVTGEIPWSSTM